MGVPASKLLLFHYSGNIVEWNGFTQNDWIDMEMQIGFYFHLVQVLLFSFWPRPNVVGPLSDGAREQIQGMIHTGAIRLSEVCVLAGYVH